MLQKVFDAQDDNGNSVEVSHAGGEVEIVLDGNFGGGTVTAKAKFPKTETFVPLNNGQFTASDVRILRTVRPCIIRLDLTGATAPNLNAWI